uniref:Putative chromaffin granule amine transporter n=1 Tax=Corethrella appendiculata TaxID=1370023 RepID=U5EU51_9DIPT
MSEYSKRQWLTLIILCLANICSAVCISLQAPFFPNEAEKKGATATEYGLVFGVFELIVFILSPVYGQFINQIGPKLLFNAGIFTTSSSIIVFGLLDKIPDRVTFITLAFVIRIIEATGMAAFVTATFTISAKEFQNNMATIVAMLETCFGIGLIIGPLIGGALYAIGGYYLPFLVLGLVLFVIAILTIIVMPRHSYVISASRSSTSFIKMLRIPLVVACTLGIVATSTSIGFLSATLEPHLRPFKLTPVVLGGFFVISGAAYAATVPAWGWMIDKCLNPKVAVLVGCVFECLGFAIIGPMPVIPIDTSLELVAVGLVFQGLGTGAILVSCFVDALRTAIKHGFPDTVETYGLVSALWTSSFSCGAFVGPSVAGYLYDLVGFRASTLFVIILFIVIAFILLIIACTEKSRERYYQRIEDNELLTNHMENSNSYGALENNGKVDETNTNI